MPQPSGPSPIFRLRSYGWTDGPLGAALPVGACGDLAGAVHGDDRVDEGEVRVHGHAAEPALGEGDPAVDTPPSTAGRK
ncbi:hypothetical protein [Streptomyces sp. NPDC093223]|uniref:hypothetical protein n=1 Tax=Streptomyces sp. NPDC093223 TaxID=3366033 RepID=UPI0038248A10